MTREIQHMERRLAETRKAFDEGFASPPAESGSSEISFLRIVAGDMPFAIRLSDISGLEADIPIVPLPAASPGLLGVGAVRGRLVSVFDLAAILGTTRTKAPRWMILAGDKEILALAFEAFEGSYAIISKDVHPVESAARSSPLTPLAIQSEGQVIHVIDVAALISGIRQATHPQ